MSIRLVFLVVLAASSTGLAALGREAEDPDPIAALNAAIQERFKDVDKFFGLRRIVMLGDSPHQFKPENVREMTAVRELEEKGLRVALYLAGRRVLEREPNLATKEPTVVNPRVIFGPIGVTKGATVAGLPREIDLIDRSRDAFGALERGDRHDFAFAGWTFTARPIRASTAQCLTCHGDRALGDALGVALYAHRPAR